MAVTQEEAIKRRLRAVPDGPGVYLFRDNRGKVIYVGKAKSIKKRVASHFSNPSTRAGRDLVPMIDQIEALVVHGRTKLRYAPVTIKTDAGAGVLTVLAERQNEFPGVVQQPVSIRSYPYGEMAAQVLGFVGQVSEPELKLRAFHGVQAGTVVGQSGGYEFKAAQKWGMAGKVNPANFDKAKIDFNGEGGTVSLNDILAKLDSEGKEFSEKPKGDALEAMRVDSTTLGLNAADAARSSSPSCSRSAYESRTASFAWAARGVVQGRRPTK